MFWNFKNLGLGFQDWAMPEYDEVSQEESEVTKSVLVKEYFYVIVSSSLGDCCLSFGSFVSYNGHCHSQLRYARRLTSVFQ